MAEALALVRNEYGELKYQVSITDNNPETLAKFSALVAGENITVHASAVEAVQGADITVLATPIDRFSGVMQEIGSHMKPGAIVTDVGSAKVKSIEQIKDNLPNSAVYIPAHPIAGKAGVGPETGSADMYDGATVMVVRGGPRTVTQQVVVEQMWQDIGGKVTPMSAFEHDRLYGTISHFQHVLAFAMTLAGEDEARPGHADEDHMKSYNTMLDTTRISVASAPMWLAIFKDNKAAIQMAADGFKTRLAALKDSLEAHDPDQPGTLYDLLNDAHEFRTGIKQDRARETVQAEVADLQAEQLGTPHTRGAVALCGMFNEAGQVALAKRTTVPTLISAALTLNAMDVGDPQRTAGLANPSFKDGSAAMLSHPEYLANLLHGNRRYVLEHLTAFEKQMDRIMDAVNREDEAALERLIEQASSIRKSMPAAHRPVRGEYAADYHTYVGQLPPELAEAMQRAL